MPYINEAKVTLDPSCHCQQGDIHSGVLVSCETCGLDRSAANWYDVPVFTFKELKMLYEYSLKEIEDANWSTNQEAALKQDLHVKIAKSLKFSDQDISSDLEH